MKGATCKFCGKSFQNRQAVRAHLKGCPAYKRLPKATVPSIGRKPRMSALQGNQASTRPTSSSLAEKDRSAGHPPRIIRGKTHGSNNAALSRLIIQSVKDRVIGSWWSLNHTIPAGTKAQAIVAIERELSQLPVDQLPRSELVTIAEGIRDGFYEPVIQAQKRAQEAEDRKRHQARQRTTLIAAGVAHANRSLRREQDLDGLIRLDLEQKVRRALDQTVDGSEGEVAVQSRVDELLKQQLEPIQRKRREQARQKLIDHGTAYAARALAQEGDLQPWERASIGREVKQDLEEEITGKESEQDVESFVDECLDMILGETEEEDQ